MICSTHTLRRLAQGAATAILGAALLVPAAVANTGPRPDGWHSYALSYTSTQQAQNHSLITDTLGGNGHRQQAPAPGYRFLTDTTAPGGGTITASSASLGPPLASSGFNWSDAGIGAAATLALVLLTVTGSWIVLRRQGRLVL